MSTTEKAPSEKPKKLFADEIADDGDQRSFMPIVVLLFVFAAGGGVVMLVQFFTEEPVEQRVVDLNARMREINNRPLTNTPMQLPGLIKPPAFSPAEANTPDGKQVVGITVGKKHRAYLIQAFTNLGNRVVNDVVGDRAITVLYDPQKDLLRVVTSDIENKPIEINLGGYLDGDMFVNLGTGPRSVRERNYKIKSPLPYADYKYDRMTWKEWRNSHPDTDIYTGRDIVIPGSQKLDARKKQQEAEAKAIKNVRKRLQGK